MIREQKYARHEQMHRDLLEPGTILRHHRWKRKSKTNCKRLEMEAKCLCHFLRAFEIRDYSLSMRTSGRIVVRILTV